MYDNFRWIDSFSLLFLDSSERFFHKNIETTALWVSNVVMIFIIIIIIIIAFLCVCLIWNV